MFSLVYDLVKIRIFAVSVPQNELFISIDIRVLIHRVRHVAPCFYSGPEQTNQTLTLEYGFCFLFFCFSSGRRRRARGATSPLDVTKFSALTL